MLLFRSDLSPYSLAHHLLWYKLYIGLWILFHNDFSIGRETNIFPGSRVQFSRTIQASKPPFHFEETKTK
ncbi:hypothetical protein I7I53_02540 [Histoplasma capsulatum var. duboisii H88]|uniref:Uncharacterized protein n=1 Tax=Ajellomyces capsulatus (strain H88) TaxID=544711 RepID=A0A8A1LLJ0_AJEC8|nr:hypothetical protein I7I53_02540 [Histoplasma capsulatum var. duboisii H88]